MLDMNINNIDGVNSNFANASAEPENKFLKDFMSNPANQSNTIKLGIILLSNILKCRLAKDKPLSKLEIGGMVVNTMLLAVSLIDTFKNKGSLDSKLMDKFGFGINSINGLVMTLQSTGAIKNCVQFASSSLLKQNNGKINHVVKISGGSLLQLINLFTFYGTDVLLNSIQMTKGNTNSVTTIMGIGGSLLKIVKGSTSDQEIADVVNRIDGLVEIAKAVVSTPAGADLLRKSGSAGSAFVNATNSNNRTAGFYASQQEIHRQQAFNNAAFNLNGNNDVNFVNL